MKLCDLLTDPVVAVNMAATDKGDLLHKLVDLAAAGNAVRDRAAALKSVEERERIMTTGIGHGVAIPHGKTEAVKDLVAAFAVLDDGIDFGALDGEPVRLAFILLGPKEPSGPHIRMLSRISRLMNREDLRGRLTQASSVSEVRALFKEAEQDMFDL
jgi:mannitol/fructose-specific phosphotransferase system IIA component (Ntr-type)